MKTRDQLAVGLTVGLFVFLWLAGNTAHREHDAEEAAVPACAYTDETVDQYLTPILDKWMEDHYPAPGPLSYEDWSLAQDKLRDLGYESIRNLRDGGRCRDLHLTSDMTEAYVLAIPHAEREVTESPSTGGGGGDVNLPNVPNVPHVRSPFHCSWSFRGGVNCGVRG